MIEQNYLNSCLGPSHCLGNALDLIYVAFNTVHMATQVLDDAL